MLLPFASSPLVGEAKFRTFPLTSKKQRGKASLHRTDLLFSVSKNFNFWALHLSPFTSSTPHSPTQKASIIQCLASFATSITPLQQCGIRTWPETKQKIPQCKFHPHPHPPPLNNSIVSCRAASVHFCSSFSNFYPATTAKVLQSHGLLQCNIQQPTTFKPFFKPLFKLSTQLAERNTFDHANTFLSRSFAKMPKATENSHIPLVCTLCPKQPRFSDVSHLLTHISSKSHLSNRFGLQIASQQSPNILHQLQVYEAWYDSYGIARLLGERMSMKTDKANGIKRPRSSTAQPKRKNVQVCVLDRLWTCLRCMANTYSAGKDWEHSSWSVWSISWPRLSSTHAYDANHGDAADYAADSYEPPIHGQVRYPSSGIRLRWWSSIWYANHEEQPPELLTLSSRGKVRGFCRVSAIASLTDSC